MSEENKHPEITIKNDVKSPEITVKPVPDVHAELARLNELLQEIALAHDELADKVDRVHKMVINHQHGKFGNPLFPLE